MASNTIDLLLTFDNKQANASIQLTNENIIKLYNSLKYGQGQAEGLTASMARGFNNAREVLQGVTAVYAGLNLIIGSTIRDYQTFETASFQLSESLKQTGIYTDGMYQSLLNYATQLQQTTVYSNEQYISLMAQYQAMGLTTEQTRDAALQTANLAALMGTDLNTAAGVMKDLLNGNTDSISKYVSGIDETTVKSGDLSRIMQELNGHIGGQAEAFANTSAGAIARMNNAFSDMQKIVGEAVSFGLTPLAEHIGSVINNLNNLSPVISGTIGSAVALSAATAILASTGIGSVIKQTLFKTAVLEAGVLAEVKASLSAAGLSVANLGLSGSFRAAGIAAKTFMSSLGPVGWIALGIGALAEVLNLFGSSADDAADKQAKLNEKFKDMDLSDLRNDLKETEKVMSDTKTQQDKLIEERKKLFNSDGATLDQIKSKNEDIAVIGNTYNKLLEYRNEVLDTIKVKEEQIKEQVEQQYAALKKRLDVELAGSDTEKSLAEAKQEFEQRKAIIKEKFKLNDEQLKKNDDYLKVEEAYNNKVKEIKNKADSQKNRDAFNEYKSELSEQQRHEDAMLNLQNHTDTQALELKKKHFEQMIALSKRFGQDSTSLVNQRIETETKLEKEYAKEKEKKEKKEKEEAEKKKAAAELAATEPLPAEKSSKALTDATKKTMHTVEVDDKKHQQNMQDSAEQTTDKKLKLLWEEKEAVADGLGQTSQMFAKHTAAYQAFASAQALIDTYTSAESAYKAMVGIPFVGPALAIGAAAAAIAAGLEQVSQINSIAVPSAPGYALGGRLKQGEAGYIEGWHNEIIAPEKTFVDLFRTELRPQIYSGMSNDNSALLMEMRKLNSSFEGYSSRPITITKDAVGKIVSKGNSQLRKSRV